MKKRLKELESEKEKIKLRLSKLPVGNFYISQNGKYDKWYYYLDGKEIYIPKKERELAENLAERKYLELAQQKMEIEIQAIKAYLKKISSNQISSRNLLNNKSYYNLLSKKYIPLSEELFSWANANYETNPAYRNRCTLECSSGHIVRSKSEMVIDEALFYNKIPFRYESGVYIDKKIRYPDFTIRHPRTGKFYYWEHLGMMSLARYANKNTEKIYEYMSAGIYPGKDLIITYEDDDKEVNASEVNKLIEFYFK